MNLPYERIVQWAAGPVSVGAGFLATELETHVDVTSFGVNKAGIAPAIIKVGTFAVGAAVTYLGHAKWLDNLSKWWNHETATSVLGSPATEAISTSPESVLRSQVVAAGLTPQA